MPKNTVSYIMRFSSEKLKKLESLTQGSLLSEEELKTLNKEELSEYQKYLDWVHMPKRSSS